MTLSRAISNLKALPGYQMKSDAELRRVVLAVLEGVREPSDAMVRLSEEYAGDDFSEHVKADWRAMIDQLISEASTP